ncbi:dihydroxyacetone kinase subunit DhaK [Streptomyces sp. NPDC050564]|uniref:dihydroxyacetone kinase subunit DhaK n=1 Tax=Streptomyces sp. NPDC050564 TaxID=3365631 RepID=UPI0037BD67B2
MAVLVFIGVGFVPALAIIGRGAPLAVAQLGMMSLAFAAAGITMVYAVAGVLAAKNVTIARCLVGNYVTSLDMTGVPIMVCKADADMLSLWDAPVNTPALHWGPEPGRGRGCA